MRQNIFQSSKRSEEINGSTVFPEDMPSGFSARQFLLRLGSSASLNNMDKLQILFEIPHMTPWQVMQLDAILEKEVVDLSNIKNGAPSGEMCQRIERDWNEVVRRYNRLTQRPPRATFDERALLTPEALQILLDSHIIGQSHVTRELSMLAYHQMLAFHLSQQRTTSLPKITRPVLLAGPTGSGKTFLVQKVSELTDLPFIHVNTPSLVGEGIVGNSLTDIGKDLLLKTDNDCKRAEFAIVFLDEFDKVLSGTYGRSIVNQLLRMIEGSELRLYADRLEGERSNTRVASLNTHNMLFVLGGSFEALFGKKKTAVGFGAQAPEDSSGIDENDLLKAGFPRELAGRINAILNLNPLTEEDYYRILTDGDSSPLQDYIALVQQYGDDVHIPDDALQEICRQAASSGLGARALHKIVYRVFKDILFEAPNPLIQTFMITRENVLDVIDGEVVRS